MNLLKDNSLSFEESTVIEKKIKDLTDNSSEIMKGLIKRIGDMPPSDYNKVITLSKELADLKMQATEIYNSDSSNKEQLIKDLKETHDNKKRELNKLVQETKILSKLDGNYTVQEKRDLYDLEVKAKNLEREIEGKDGAEVLVKKEELKRIREKQNNIAINSMFTTQAKGVGAINEILKNKGLSGIEVINATTEQEAIDQHDKIVDKLVEAGELTEAKAKAQKASFLQTIKSAEAAKTTINKTDYVFNIKDLDTSTYMNLEEMQNMCNKLELETVPILDKIICDESWTIQKFQDYANTITYGDYCGEGIVIRDCNDITISFKIINQNYKD
jgi:polyhydroxyalkanoate synthesis regulator phasin